MAEQQLVEIKIDIRDAVKKITDVENKIHDTEQAVIDLNEKAAEENRELSEQERRRIEEQIALGKVYKKQKKDLQKQIENEMRVRVENNDSLKAMRAELSSLRNTYDGLTAAQRQSTNGELMAKQIRDLNDAITKAEEATGRFQRNVGNYYGKMMEAIEDSMTVWKQWGTGGAQAFEGISKASAKAYEEMKKEAELNGESFDGFSGKVKAGGLQIKATLQSLVGGFGALGKSLLALAANPVVLAISALVAVLVAAYNAIQKNEELVNRLSVAFAKLAPVTDLLCNALDAVAGVLVSMIEGFATLAGAVVDFVGSVRGAGEESTKYAKIQQDHIKLEEAERDAILAEAQAENKIAKLKHHVAEVEKKDRKQARADLMEINKLEEGVAKAKQARAVEALRLAEEEAAKGPNDAEANKKLIELRAAVVKADTEYYNKTKENVAKLAQFDDETKKKAEEAEKKAKEKREKKAKEAKEAAKKELELERKVWAEKIKGEIAGIEAQKALRKKADEEFFKDLAERSKKELEELKLRQRMRLAYEQKTAKEDEKVEQLKAAQSKQTILTNMASLAEERTALELRRQRGELASEKDYNEKRAELEARMAEQNVQLVEWTVEQELALKKEKEKAEQALASATSQLLSTSLGQSKEGVILQKAITTAQVALSSAEAISKAVASASSGDPYTVALRIGTAVASVTSAIATAYDAINSVGFAAGGYVKGSGSTTSDSVPARLSAGEAVMNARAVKYYSPLLSAINQSTGGAPIANAAGASVNDSDFLGRQLAGAVAGIRPQVSVRDFIGVQNRLNAVRISARLG